MQLFLTVCMQAKCDLLNGPTVKRQFANLRDVQRLRSVKTKHRFKLVAASQLQVGGQSLCATLLNGLQLGHFGAHFLLNYRPKQTPSESENT